ncbi:hypothetical protein cand_006620 [Cryptosporidium andersoni]|uniref:Uncharacterized protein n=1 Tax=Cryptosporidium andersoni TaxID=117008 RepID=A0A1J4MPZ7_9CRYT|nr:hypothetical protein cand_006620 [Cryptosporidium andersoni]
MEEATYSVHSPAVFEVRKAAKSSRKSAPPVIRVIPRLNKRYQKSPYSIDQMNKISLKMIEPYRNIFKDAVVIYTEKKIKSTRKCEMIRKIMIERENGIFNNLQKCLIYDTDWMKEKIKLDESDIVKKTEQEIEPLTDVFLLKSVINDKIHEQKKLLEDLKLFWKEYPDKLKTRIRSETLKLNDILNMNILEENIDTNTNLPETMLMKGKDSFNQDLHSEEIKIDQMNVAASICLSTTNKFVELLQNVTQKMEQILNAEQRLNIVAKAIIDNPQSV